MIPCPHCKDPDCSLIHYEGQNLFCLCGVPLDHEPNADAKELLKLIEGLPPEKVAALFAFSKQHAPKNLVSRPSRDGMENRYRGVTQIASNYKGRIRPRTSPFLVRVWCRGKHRYFGCFDDALRAARAYDNIVFHLHKERFLKRPPVLNFPEEYAVENPPPAGYMTRRLMRDLRAEEAEASRRNEYIIERLLNNGRTA